MKKTIICLLMVLFAVCSCNKGELSVTEENQPVSFTVVSGNDTKTVLTGTQSGSTYTYNMTWSGNETLTVAEVLTTYPTDREASSFKTPAESIYTFTNQSGPGTSAEFTCNDFPSDGFATGRRYIVATPGERDYFSTMRDYSYPSSHVSRYLVGFGLRNVEQNYNPADEILGLYNDIIPVYGIIERGGGTGHELNAVSMRTPCSVIRLKLTNNTGSAKTISFIRLTQSSTSTYRNVCGNPYMNLSADTGDYPIMVSTGVLCTWGTNVDLRCNLTMDAGETKVFGFVVIGNQDPGTYTWRIYVGNSVFGQEITATPGTIEPGCVYTATRNWTE